MSLGHRARTQEPDEVGSVRSWCIPAVKPASHNRLGVTPRTLRVLARLAVKGVGCEGPGTSSGDLAVTSRRFVNRRDVI